ncbi:Uncharacterized protein PBTT_10150 [Plasmodiophora brassicae]|uniref:Uncharacterized protein n=1 Tax=Plasmodiophora brassicae TaxID=37360 RepID=A0A0G4INX8_PLABS|nr:hypothetical protein PBRA_005489 [Plasmodiophora brassicae]SPR01842.1 unnamed protein product [Plasmodiophora brassicae]
MRALRTICQLCLAAALFVAAVSKYNTFDQWKAACMLCQKLADTKCTFDAEEDGTEGERPCCFKVNKYEFGVVIMDPKQLDQFGENRYQGCGGIQRLTFHFFRGWSKQYAVPNIPRLPENLFVLNDDKHLQEIEILGATNAMDDAVEYAQTWIDILSGVEAFALDHFWFQRASHFNDLSETINNAMGQARDIDNLKKDEAPSATFAQAEPQISQLLKRRLEQSVAGREVQAAKALAEASLDDVSIQNLMERQNNLHRQLHAKGIEKLIAEMYPELANTYATKLMEHNATESQQLELEQGLHEKEAALEAKLSQFDTPHKVRLLNDMFNATLAFRDELERKRKLIADRIKAKVSVSANATMQTCRADVDGMRIQLDNLKVKLTDQTRGTRLRYGVTSLAAVAGAAGTSALAYARAPTKTVTALPSGGSQLKAAAMGLVAGAITAQSGLAVQHRIVKSATKSKRGIQGPVSKPTQPPASNRLLFVMVACAIVVLLSIIVASFVTKRNGKVAQKITPVVNPVKTDFE